MPRRDYDIERVTHWEFVSFLIDSGYSREDAEFQAELAERFDADFHHAGRFMRIEHDAVRAGRRDTRLH
jgi:hypothetical protein